MTVQAAGRRQKSAHSIRLPVGRVFAQFSGLFVTPNFAASVCSWRPANEIDGPLSIGRRSDLSQFADRSVRLQLTRDLWAINEDEQNSSHKIRFTKRTSGESAERSQLTAAIDNQIEASSTFGRLTWSVGLLAAKTVLAKMVCGLLKSA